MLLRKMVFLGVAIVFLFLGSAAIAQEEIACADIEWLPAVTNAYPNIADACTDVVVKNGKTMAKVRVKVVRVNSRDVSFRFLLPDGTLSDVYRTARGTELAIMLDGRRVGQRELVRGQELNVYIPNDRWAVIPEDMDGPDLADAVALVEEPEPMADPEPMPEPMPSLPATAGPLPLIGLLGGVFLALGAGLRFLRRRVR